MFISHIFSTVDYVRLGTHRDLDLIFVRPIDTPAENLSGEITDRAYKIDDTVYTGEVSCRRFLQQHKYHHTTTTRYVPNGGRMQPFCELILLIQLSRQQLPTQYRALESSCPENMGIPPAAEILLFTMWLHIEIHST